MARKWFPRRPLADERPFGSDQSNLPEGADAR
jgi:hypothetical protein